MKSIQRHDLLEISDAGRREAFAGIAPEFSLAQLELVRKIVVGDSCSVLIPGIVRREEIHTPVGTVPVGFASPFRLEGYRLRVAAFVPSDSVLNIISPQEVLRRPFVARTPALKSLAEIISLGRCMELELGIWGSAAMELFTELPYTDEKSDLDLLMGIASMEKLSVFNEKIAIIGRQQRCGIDVEICLPSGFGVKLKEVLTDTNTVLGKGLHEVVLLEKRSLFTRMTGV